ncbi:MAG: non-homologous end-joining DNA ligase [Nitriliruptorales bacterium]|nr:non-homologous end-joining DNA ligase [Nitriliruptorales bacterium]
MADEDGEPVELELAGQVVRVTSPDKVFFTKRSETKLDLVNYYVAIAEPLMRTMGGRPVLLQRFPNGASGKSFFQKRVPKGAPDWLTTTVVSTPNGTTSNALVAVDIAHVVWAVNMGCLGFHVWPYLADDPEHADELRIDLDPSPGVDLAMIRQAAWHLKELLDEHGIRSWPKLSGRRGLHIYSRLQPRWDSFQVRHAAVAIARELERRHPDLITAEWWKELRGKRVFVDFNQNAPHKTVFGAWSVRPRVGATVSMPIRWKQLDELKPDEMTIDVVPAAVERDGDAWEDYGDDPQDLTPLLELHERDRANGLMDAPWPPVYPKMPDEPPRVQPSRARKPDDEG